MQLPEGWITKTLGECFRLKSGDNLTARMMNSDGRYPVFGGNGIAGYHSEYNLDGSNVIVGRVGALCGNVRHISEKIWLTDNCFRVLDKQYSFDDAFLAYLLNSKNLGQYARKAAQPVVSNSSLKDVLISFPLSIKEQKRIVAILDEAFAGISQAIANTEKNLANARELFERYVELKFSIDLRNEKTLKLGELSEVKSGGTPSKAKPTYWNGKFAWYSSGELNQLETIGPENYITLEGLDNSNAKIFPKGSLLIGMYDTAALKMSILDRDAAFNQAISGMKPCERVDLIFVMYAIRAIKENVLNLRRGVRQKNLSLQKIKDISIPVPTRQKQDELIKNLKDLIQVTGRQMNLYQQKLQSLAELKQSLLQKAFSGELTANNVDKWVNP